MRTTRKIKRSTGWIVLIEASKLSLKDKFMQYTPKLGKEQKFYDQLEEVIKKGVKDFWRPRIDPSFNEDKTDICYVPGKEPAVGKSYGWYKEAAEIHDSYHRSRIGTKSQYVAFLGVLIKTLVANNWTVEDAWHAVCVDSSKLGHYRNSENPLCSLEPTASREIYGFFDLINTFKILANDEDDTRRGFWFAGGCYNCNSCNYPLTTLCHVNGGKRSNSVVWLVFEEDINDN